MASQEGKGLNGDGEGGRLKVERDKRQEHRLTMI